jgi:hypothetical protein
MSFKRPFECLGSSPALQSHPCPRESRTVHAIPAVADVRRTPCPQSNHLATLHDHSAQFWVEIEPILEQEGCVPRLQGEDLH